MKEPFHHAMMPMANHDERAREQIVASFKIHMEDQVYPANGLVYEKKIKPAFTKQNGREPKDRHEVRKAMSSEPYYQMWSAIARTLQEQLWDNVGQCVERQLPALMEQAKVGRKTRGSLTLDPKVEVPRYNADIDIHCMPGGYHTELCAGDVYAGALYDRGGYFYALPLMGSMAHQVPQVWSGSPISRSGVNVIALVRRKFPDLKPKRILDMGCTVGGATTAYVEQFPDAEIYAIDLAAPQLRYGHARAEALGLPIHFSQQNAEATNFPDGYFDLVVSHGLFHETSFKAAHNIFRETYRLLRAGGVTMHSDPQFSQGLTAHDSFMHDWDTHYNNEPFWGTLHDRSPADWLAEAGYDRATVQSVWTRRTVDGRPDFVPAGETSRITGAQIFGARK
ncbi:MAG: class I SAM-dependent methyltransferase [Alphaproteobacteria bacterium]|nr:class I SAM-dependent methyltransferase [Alphaproteobacteria bacterium]